MGKDKEIASAHWPWSWDETVFVVESAKDSQGRTKFSMLWRTDYIPGHPDGETPKEQGKEFLIRAQCYNTNLDQHVKLAQDRGRIIRIVRSLV